MTLHARLSVEFDVTEEQMRKIMDRATDHERGLIGDLDVSQIKDIVDIKTSVPVDWDNFGYIPSSWLEYDLVDGELIAVNKEEK